MGHPHLTTDKFRSKFHSVFFCPIKPGAAEAGPYTHQKPGAPIKGPDQSHRDAKGAHRGAENAQAAPLRETVDGRRARLKPAPTHTKSRAPRSKVPIKAIGMRKAHIGVLKTHSPSQEFRDLRTQGENPARIRGGGGWGCRGRRWLVLWLRDRDRLLGASGGGLVG